MNQFLSKFELRFQGNTKLLDSPCLAVIGTRQMTQYGKRVTKKLVKELSAAGITTVSGLMYGVDATAHQAALECGGATIAVLGYGLGKVPQQGQAKLAQEVLAKGGLLVSQFSDQQPAQKHTFVQRNEVIAALSSAVLVIEAARKSGTHLTVNFALEQGKEILAVPGSIFSVYSEGTRWLHNQGAHMVATGQEVCELLGWESGGKNTQLSFPTTSAAETQLLSALSTEPASISQLQQGLGQKRMVLEPLLWKLELAGLVYHSGEVWYAADL